MSEIKLSTGRTLNANGGILGLSLKGDGVLYAGYDNPIEQGSPPRSYDDEEDRAERLTPAERRELADRMIALWNDWATASAPPAA